MNNFYESMSHETKQAIDHLVSTLDWTQVDDSDTQGDFIGDMQIHLVAKLEDLMTEAAEEFGIEVVGKTALKGLQEEI